MKKGLSVAVALLFFGTGSHLSANEALEGWFIGGEIGGLRAKTQHRITGGATPQDERISLSTSYETVKIGKYLDFGRVYGMLGHHNKKWGIKANSFGLGYDYLFKEMAGFTPFTGVTAGYIKERSGIEEWDNITNTWQTVDKKSYGGMYYGLEAGAIYGLSEHFEVELGARFVKSHVKTTWNWSSTEVLEYKHKYLTQYYIGINYRF